MLSLFHDRSDFLIICAFCLNFFSDGLSALSKCSNNYFYPSEQIKKALRGVKIEVTHRGNMRRKYRISGLTSQTTRELT